MRYHAKHQTTFIVAMALNMVGLGEVVPTVEGTVEDNLKDFEISLKLYHKGT